MMRAQKFHRDAKPIPTDPAERKARVRWCVEHRLWHHPVAHREPPPGRESERFRPPDERGLSEMVFDGPDWITTTIFLGGFDECVDIDHAYVDPTTERIEDDEARNTTFRVWIEAGGWLDESQNLDGYWIDVKHVEDPGYFIASMPAFGSSACSAPGDTREKAIAALEPVYRAISAHYVQIGKEPPFKSARTMPEGGWNDHNKWIRCHSISLDCGEPDMETAILELAARVEFHYGEGADRINVPSRCECRKVEGVPDDAPAAEQYISTCIKDAEGYCAKCGYTCRS